MTESSVILFPAPRGRARPGPVGPPLPLAPEAGAPPAEIPARPGLHWARAVPGDRQMGPAASSAWVGTEYEPPTRIRAFEDYHEQGFPKAWHEWVPVGEVPGRAHGTDPGS